MSDTMTGSQQAAWMESERRQRRQSTRSEECPTCTENRQSRGENAQQDGKRMRNRLAWGAGLFGLGLTRKSGWAKALTLVPAATLLGSAYLTTRQQKGIDVADDIVVQRSPKEVYDFVRKLENQPRYMSHTHSVTQSEDGTIHWAMDVAGGVRLEWDGRLTEERPGQRLAWKSLPDNPFDETAAITLSPEGDDATRVHMHMKYYFKGKAASAAMQAFRGFTRSMLSQELQDLKREIEGGRREDEERERERRARTAQEQPEHRYSPLGESTHVPTQTGWPSQM